MGVKQIYKKIAKMNRSNGSVNEAIMDGVFEDIPEITPETAVIEPEKAEPVIVEKNDEVHETVNTTQEDRAKNKRVKRIQKDEQQTIDTGGDVQDGGNPEQD